MIGEREKMEQNQYEIKLMLDDNRYNNLLDLCKKYRTQHSTNLTPTEYILILIDSAIDSVDGTKAELETSADRSRQKC